MPLGATMIGKMAATEYRGQVFLFIAIEHASIIILISLVLLATVISCGLAQLLIAGIGLVFVIAV
jgi:hypothetical protein